MPDKLPIDYARADSADVVRKKFRRRVVMFVIATVVVIVVGFGWAASWLERPRTASSRTSGLPGTIVIYKGWISLNTSKANVPSKTGQFKSTWSHGSYSLGVRVSGVETEKASFPTYFIRYRTFFILAMIPWIITLIRMIRVWKRKRAAALISDL